MNTRTTIRDVLSAARNPDQSIPTLTGDLYFDDQHAAVRPVQFTVGRTSPIGIATVESAPYQLTTFSPSGRFPRGTTRHGWAFVAQGITYTIQRVVTTGFNINQLSELDPATQTFGVDFFIWFKYEGSDGPPPTSGSPTPWTRPCRWVSLSGVPAGASEIRPLSGARNVPRDDGVLRVPLTNRTCRSRYRTTNTQLPS